MLYCLSLCAQLTISYMLCTYWLSGKAGQDNVWLEVMTYEPRAVISYHFLVAGGFCFNWLIERPTKLNALPNWMAHFQIEWLIIEWPTKLNGLLLNGPPNRMGHHWVIHFHYRVAHRASSAGPNARNLVYTRRQPIAGESFLKLGVFRIFPCFVYSRSQNSYVFGFPSGARDWDKSHGILFWLGRGPKIVSCSRQKIVIQS